MTRWISGIKLHDFNCGLKAYKLKVVKNIQVYGEMHRYIPLLAKWNGFGKIGEKVVQHQARKYGVSKFGIERFLNGFLDLISVSFVHRYKKKPMHFFGLLGTLFFCFWFLDHLLAYFSEGLRSEKGSRGARNRGSTTFLFSFSGIDHWDSIVCYRIYRGVDDFQPIQRIRVQNRRRNQL